MSKEKGGHMHRTHKIILSCLLLILINIPQLSAQTTLDYSDFPYQKWVLIGLPLTPNNSNPDTVFKIFGKVGQNWRLSRWDITHNAYIRYGEVESGGELGDPPSLQPGLGYWFYQNSKANTTLSVTGTLAPTDTTYYIALNPPVNDHRGLNMVANPFNFPIDWKNSRVKISDGYTETEVSLLDANNYYLCDNYAYRWDVEQQVYVPYNAVDGGVFNVWDGFWVEQLSQTRAELVVYKLTGDTDSDIFYEAKVLGVKDYLGTDFARETDHFDLTVTGVGSYVWVTTECGTSKKTTQFQLIEGRSQIDGNGIEIRLAAIVSGQYTTYRFHISSTEIKNKSGMKKVTFDFKQGQIIAPSKPQGGANDVTVLRTPMETKKALFSLELAIPPTQSLPKPVPTKQARLEPANERDWFVPLSIQDASGNYKDLYNGIGVRSDATDNYEIYDAKNFAPMKANNDFVDLYFPHNDTTDMVNYWWNRPEIFCYDVRGDSSSKVWKMTIAAYNIPNRTLTLSWDATGVNSDWNLTLYDPSNQKTIDMLTQTSYTFTSPNKQYSQLPFTITANFLGVVKVNKEPRASAFQIMKVFPNPFNATTHIYYSLSQPGQATLTIYNTLGQMVHSYSSFHPQSGSYILTWNGQDQHGTALPSGIYFCRLTTNTTTQMSKVILLR